MPVRSLRSSVFTWPARAVVLDAARAWAETEARRRPDVIRIGMFGSYARDDAGVGSDLDLVAVLRDTAIPFVRRAAAWDLTTLPVPAELLVYTEAEWQALQAAQTRFAQTLAGEMLWLADHPRLTTPGSGRNHP